MNRDALIGGGGTAAIGATYLIQSFGYRIGTPAVMGPGFFPAILSGLLVLLGIAIARAPVSESTPTQSDERRSALAVIAAILAFALLVERAGAIPATIALIFISGLAAPVFRPMQLAAICVVMVGFVYGVFIQLLHLPHLCLAALRVIEHLELGLHVAFTPVNLLYCFIGVTLGNLVGTIPGLGTLAAISILLPVTYFVPSTSGLIMLAGLYYGAVYGGATSAILLNIPHTATSMLVLDGYPLAQKGRAGVALFLTTIASLCGSVVGIIVVAFAAPVLANAALTFESPEYFALMVLGLAGATILARSKPLQALSTMILGMLLGMTGIDLNSGTPRFTFGLTPLMDGVNIGIVAIGLFGVAEIIRNAMRKTPPMDAGSITLRSLVPTMADVRTAIAPLFRGVGLGSLLGVLPSAGTILAPIMAYTFEKQIARDPDRFGQGAIEGIVAPESAANAAAQTGFVPTLTLGIPTDPVMAVMLGALLMKGVAPGPSFISAHPDMFWGLVVSFVIGNVLLVIWHLPLIGLWVRMLTIPFHVLYPPVLVFICFGAYAIRQSMLDVVGVAFFGIVGAAMRRYGFAPAPLLIGFILGPMSEEQLRRSLSISRGDPSVFFTRPLCAAGLFAAVLVVLWTIYQSTKASRASTISQPINAQH